MNQSKQLVRLIEIAIMTAAAVILDIVSGMFLRMPQGGSVSIMMIPIFLISFRWGVKAGLTTGLLTGLVQIAIGNLFAQHPIQLLLDYIVAFAAIGISGCFASSVRKAAVSKTKGKLIISVVSAVLSAVSCAMPRMSFQGQCFSAATLQKEHRYGFIP